MQANDREEFKTELSKLCAGLGVPMTKAREEAFWGGLKRMSVGQFRNCVDHALAQEWPDDTQPTTTLIWRIYKGTALAPVAKSHALEEADHLEYFANRLLWLHMSHRGGLGSTGQFVPTRGMVESKASDELTRCLKFKRDLVAEFSGYIREGDDAATPANFVLWWLSGLSKISEVLPRTRRDLQDLAGREDEQKPFPISMARRLTPTQPELV